ncbi:MAG: rubrerythrin family protein [Bacteroidia bacterium]|nr:rubrerythrin family protein [Bacteroidia bacterium]
MKKSFSPLFLVALFIAAIFQSCSNNPQANAEMKKPAEQVNTASDATLENEDSEEGKSADATSGTAQNTNINDLNNKNLQDAFKGETTASAKYLAYSQKAEAEGFHEIALLFKATSLSEKIHANNHRAVLEENGQKIPVITPEFTVKSTAENLKDAIEGEGYEITTMYPEFITAANTAGDQLSLVSLNYAYKTEKKHKPLYEKALQALQSNNVKSLASIYYVCPTCGNTYDTSIPKRCGISMTTAEKFVKIDNLNL